MNDTKPKARHAILLLAALAVYLPFLGCGRDAPQRNLILITVDTLRPDKLECYGFHLPTSPALDRFAAESLVFESVYAQAPSTSPSLASLMTSLMPPEAGVPRNGTRFNPDQSVLAEILAKNGYNTAAFVSNFVIRKGLGFERGFRLYNDKLPDKEMNRSRVVERTAEDTTAAVLDWIAAGPKEPFFLWVHYQDPHGPYAPPPSYKALFLDDTATTGNSNLPLNDDNKGIKGIPLYQQYEGERDRGSYEARYLGEIRYFDDSFAKLKERLEGTGLYDRSILVFTADHGEAMGEHDYYYAHGEYVYENQIRVPLLIRIPGQDPDRIVSPCTLMDLYPTLLNGLGFEVPTHVRGQDLLDASKAPRPIFCHAAKSKFTIRNRWALIFESHKIIFTEPGDWELYDLKDDPGEEKNLVDSSPDKAESYKKLLLRELGRIQKRSKKLDPIEMDAETLEKLKGLGYGGY